MAVAIVLAAGSGKRMNSHIAKQFIKIRDKEVLYYSLYTLNNNENISTIVLVARDEDIKYCQKNIVDEYNLHKVGKIISGGKERYDSVYNGLAALKGSTDKDDIVLIHDGARPFLQDEMINTSIRGALEYGACTVAVPVKDTIKLVDDKMLGIETPDRKSLYQIQTPQSFRLSLLSDAYEEMKKCPNHNITDDTMLMEQYRGIKSKIVPGEYTNIKITTPEDIEIAELFAGKIFQKTLKTC